MGIRSSTWCWRVGIWQGCLAMPVSPDTSANITPTYSTSFSQCQKLLRWTAKLVSTGFLSSRTVFTDEPNITAATFLLFWPCVEISRTDLGDQHVCFLTRRTCGSSID